MHEGVPHDKLTKRLEEWEKLSKQHEDRIEALQPQIQVKQAELETALGPIIPELPTSLKFLEPIRRISPIVPQVGAVVAARAINRRRLSTRIKAEMDVIAAELVRNEFYTRLYFVIPDNLSGARMLLQTEAAVNIDLFPSTVDEFLEIVKPPPGLPQSELESIRDTVQDMLEAFEEIPEETVARDFPALVVPPKASPATGIRLISQMTTEELVKQFTRPRLPNPVLPDDEWQELIDRSYPEYADMTRVQIVEAEANRIIAASKLAGEQAANFQAGIAEMPDYQLTDFLKEMVVMPGVATSEVAAVYFEKTSQPMAAVFYKGLIPDIETLYQKHRMTSDSDWSALQKAWEEWDAPGSGVPEFLLKYMLMETLADPLTWLAVFTLGTSMVAGMTGRFVRFAVILNKANRVVFAPFEVPFDGIKAIVGKFPKTISQRAAIVESLTSRVGRVYLDKYVGKGKSVRKGMTMKDWTRLANRAIRYAFDNPQASDEIATFGRSLLKHKPIDQKDIAGYSEALGHAIPKEDITQQMVSDINTIFETVFSKWGSKKGKLMLPAEGGKRLLDVLGLGGSKPQVQKLAARLLNRRASRIVAEARLFANHKNPNIALRKLGQRNFKTHIIIEESTAWLAKNLDSRTLTLLDGIGGSTKAIWQNYVEKYVVRTMAEAYLTFGMYGPMNVIEDIHRSTLGGVFPRRMTVDRLQMLSFKLQLEPSLIDPTLGISEAIGKLRRHGSEDSWNNWILQLATLGQKEWADKLFTGLVRLPGGFGMDIRRNFVGQKYLVLFKEMGGQKVELILKAEGRAPALADKKLIKELKQAVYDAKTTLDIDNIRAVKDMFTRKSIYRKEVNNILKDHPDLPNSVRDFLLESFDDDTLFAQGPKSIHKAMREANNRLVNEYLRGAEHATKQFQQLTDVLTSLEVKNPEEMAHLMLNLNIASMVYGATPKQIMAQATISSRGLPLAERRARFDKSFDDIIEFMEKAGGNIEEIVNKLRVDIQAGKGFGPEHADKSTRLFDLMESKRQVMDKFRTENIEWRREMFAGVEQKDMTSEWWDDFFIQSDAQYHGINLKMMRLDGDITRTIKDVDLAAGIKPFDRPAVKAVDHLLAVQDVASLLGVQGDDLSRAILDSLTIMNDKDGFIEYVLAQARPGLGDEGFTRESVGAVYDQIALSLKVKPETMSWITSKQMELEAVRQDLHYLHKSKLVPEEELTEIARYVDETADAVEELAFTRGPGIAKEDIKARIAKPLKPPPGPPTLKPEFQDIDKLRQSAMDEAQKWYFKEYVDYTNGNAFDSMMKVIYPFWNYESQRFFWLPRSFVRHPGTFTASERWKDNTDFGYIPIAGTSIELNPARGTIYGPLTTRLSRRDYPDYYDAWENEGAESVVQFMDFLSRYGFYPNAVWGIGMAAFGGMETQMGEVLPAVWKTPLMGLQAAAPDNKTVEFITDHIFGERFRNYMNMTEVTARGGNGTLINSKRNSGIELTPEEDALWYEARRPTALKSMFFEQSGLLRNRPPEKREMFKAITSYIEEKYGVSEQQQDWYRKHGYRIWDELGGMSLEDQEFLQALDSWKWSSLAGSLYPSRQQLVLDRNILDWDEIGRYVEDQRDQMSTLEREMLSASRSVEDYLGGVSGLYDRRRDFIKQKQKENTLLTLEGRTEYFEENGIPMPVQHVLRELMNLFFSIEVVEVRDPSTGEIIKDWDTFWAERLAIEEAVPDHLKGEWDTFLSRHNSPLMDLRREINEVYISKYNQIWEQVLGTYSEDEQNLIKEFLFLEKMRLDFPRQSAIKEMVRTDEKRLVAGFRSDVSEAKRAFRFANPTLDAWLFYWGKVDTRLTPQSEAIYIQLAKDTGRRIN